MATKRSDEAYSDKEAEQRATAALRRALSTPYKPQSNMKIGGKPKKKRATEKPESKSAMMRLSNRISLARLFR